MAQRLKLSVGETLTSTIIKSGEAVVGRVGGGHVEHAALETRRLQAIQSPRGRLAGLKGGHLHVCRNTILAQTHLDNFSVPPEDPEHILGVKPRMPWLQTVNPKAQDSRLEGPGSGASAALRSPRTRCH